MTDPWLRLPDPYAGTTPWVRAELPLSPQLVRENQRLLRAWTKLVYNDGRPHGLARPRKKEPR